MEAIVEFEYTAERNDELSLKVGDRITNIKTAEGGWYEGELNGKRGLFPDNFVKLLNVPAEIPETNSKDADLQRDVPQRKSVRELANKFKNNIPVGPQKKKEKQKRCKVLFEYTKSNDDELDLVEGNIIEFIREVEDGWYEGSINGKQGVFPSNFVEMLEDTVSPEEGNTTSVDEKVKPAETVNKDSDFNSIKGKKVVGVGLGNIFNSGPIELRTVKDNAKNESSQKLPQPEKPIHQEKTTQQENPFSVIEEVALRNKPSSNLLNCIEQAIVRFSYTAEQPDELSLEEGQIIRILKKDLEDEGWWKGEINGKVGIFPDNFVNLLPNEEKNQTKKTPAPAAPINKGALPKLPEKIPTGDTPDDKAKSEQGFQVALRKPQMPPPMTKRPLSQKPVETKLEQPNSLNQINTVKDKHLVKESSVDYHNSEGSASLNDIEPSSQKLTHLTYGRAQGPKKRPPSSAIILNEKTKTETSEIKINIGTVPDKLPPRLPARAEVPLLPPKDYKPPPQQTDQSSVTPQISSTTSVVREHHTNPPPSIRPPELSRALPNSQNISASKTQNISFSNTQNSIASKTQNVSVSNAQNINASNTHDSSTSNIQTSKLIDQLRIQLAELKATTVSKTMFKDLQNQHEKLKMDFENMKKGHSIKIRDLTNEIDAEKKLRLTTQIDIDRLKKSLTESNI